MSRIYPNHPGGKSLSKLTVADLSKLPPSELVVVADDAQLRMTDLHFAENGEIREKTPEESAEFQRLLTLRDAADMQARIITNMKKHPRSVVMANGTEYRSAGRRPGGGRSAEFMPQRSPWHEMHEIFGMADGEARDAALGALEERGEEMGLRPGQLDQADGLLRSVLSAENPNCDGSYIARRALITESPAYRSAFAQLMTEAHPMLTGEEVEAVRALKALELAEFRAMSEGTTTAGGFGVPVFIDPSIVLTAGAGAAPILDVARVERVTTSQWKGVSSAGVTWSWDAEGSAVSDDSPTLAQPAVPIFTGRGFLPYSIELGQDYPGFAEQMAALLSQGSLDLLAASTATGSGSGQPKGVITALQAVSGSQVRVATAGTVVAADIFKTWNALPERFRSQPSTGWGMSVSVESTIRSFSSPTSSSAYFTIDLTDEGLTYLNGKKVTRTDYFPAITGGTSTQAYAVVGDWHNYLVALRAGMSIEPIQTLFDVSTGRPTGQRGYFAWLRSGHDVINPAGFRILDQT